MKKKYYLYKMNKNVIYIYPLLLLVLCSLIFFLIYQSKCSEVLENNINLSLILIIPYCILHELLHSLSYVIHGAKFKNITYGIVLEEGVMCCLCKQNITKKNILFSLLYPFVFISIVTSIIGIIFNIPVLVILSLFNVVGCSGDLVMFYDIVKLKDIEYSEYDDPTSFGLYTKNDLSKKKMLGLDYLGTKEKLEIKDLRKIYISKMSFIILIIFAIMSIIEIVDMIIK